MRDDIENNTASLSSIIKQAINNKLLDVHTCLPGYITKFDPVTQLASVQPSIKRTFKGLDQNNNTTHEEHPLPELINVPVIFPRGGGFSFTFPIAVNDECLLYFSERSIDNWNKDGGVVSPSAYRQHSLSDAFALVGIGSQPNLISSFSSTDAQLRNENNNQNVTMKANGDIELNSTTKVVVNSPQTDIVSPAINLIGDTAVTGTLTASIDVVAAGISSIGHTHPQAADSGGDTQASTGAPV